MGDPLGHTVWRGGALVWPVALLAAVRCPVVRCIVFLFFCFPFGTLTSDFQGISKQDDSRKVNAILIPNKGYRVYLPRNMHS